MREIVTIHSVRRLLHSLGVYCSETALTPFKGFFEKGNYIGHWAIMNIPYEMVIATKVVQHFAKMSFANCRYAHFILHIIVHLSL